jgi:hypothetical protein
MRAGEQTSEHLCHKTFARGAMKAQQAMRTQSVKKGPECGELPSVSRLRTEVVDHSPFNVGPTGAAA